MPLLSNHPGNKWEKEKVLRKDIEVLEDGPRLQLSRMNSRQ